MILSNILDGSDITQKYEILNEQEIDTLGLVVTDLESTFCTFLDDDKYLGVISEKARMIITKKEIAEQLLRLGKGVCIVEEPRLFFFLLHNYLCSINTYVRERFKTIIGEGCNISNLSSISNENIIIGKNVIIEEFVVIRENTTIEDNSIIRAGCVIGGEGYEFKRDEEKIFGVKHVGGVKIGRNVEIQYNSCVDKGVYPYDNTEVGNYSKIDNLVHIAHGVKVEDNVMIVAQSGIGGRTKIKSGTWIGFGSTISNGIIIGENSRANIGAVVTKSVENNESVTGNFAIQHKKFIDNLKLSCK